jgi:GNAT superfamily N-acetyltransferase
VIDGEDYRMVVLPESFDRATNVANVQSTRPAAELTNEVHALARERGIAEVTWNVYPTTTPPGLAAYLLEMQGTIRDESGLMSLRVPNEGHLDVGPTRGVLVKPVGDAEGLTDYRRIVSTVFEQPMATAEEIAAEASHLNADDPDAGAGCRFVAYVDGRPAGTGAIAVREDGSASLFGAATYPELRGRGAYRAILAARTRWAWQHDVPLLLVSGRLATSAPIMRRAGFTLHGYSQAIAVPT